MVQLQTIEVEKCTMYKKAIGKQIRSKTKRSPKDEIYV